MRHEATQRGPIKQTERDAAKNPFPRPAVAVTTAHDQIRPMRLGKPQKVLGGIILRGLLLNRQRRYSMTCEITRYVRSAPVRVSDRQNRNFGSTQKQRHAVRNRAARLSRIIPANDDAFRR